MGMVRSICDLKKELKIVAWELHDSGEIISAVFFFKYIYIGVVKMEGWFLFHISM